MPKKIKLWLFKKIFKNEIKTINKEINDLKTQIENLKKRCQELNKANEFLLKQDYHLNNKLKINHLI